MTQITLRVEIDLDRDIAVCSIDVPGGTGFGVIMAACEQFLHFAASASPAGYDKALALLVAGAKSCRGVVYQTKPPEGDSR